MAFDIGNLLRDIFNFDTDKDKKAVPEGMRRDPTIKDKVEYLRYRGEQARMNSQRRNKGFVDLFSLEDWITQGYPQAR